MLIHTVMLQYVVVSVLGSKMLMSEPLKFYCILSGASFEAHLISHSLCTQLAFVRMWMGRLKEVMTSCEEKL